jgi:hypothetical protein
VITEARSDSVGEPLAFLSSEEAQMNLSSILMSISVVEKFETYAAEDCRRGVMPEIFKEQMKDFVFFCGEYEVKKSLVNHLGFFQTSLSDGRSLSKQQQSQRMISYIEDMLKYPSLPKGVGFNRIFGNWSSDMKPYEGKASEKSELKNPPDVKWCFVQESKVGYTRFGVW